MVSSFKNCFLALLVAVGFQTISAQTVKNLLVNSSNQIGQLDFSSGTLAGPPTTIPGSTTPDIEAIGHAEDANGDLLFYATGNGVYRPNGVQMPGSVGMLGDESVTEVSVCKIPGEQSKFYVIYSEDVGCSDIYYSIVDMTASLGNGDVILDTLLVAGDFGEGKELVRKPGSPEFWLVLYDCNWGFRTMDVKQTGISTLQGLKAFNPAIQNVFMKGRGELDYFNENLGYSHTGADKLYIGDFDPCVRSMNTVATPDVTQPYGMEFSMSSQYAYATLYNAQANDDNIFQYRMSDGNSLTHNAGAANCAGDTVTGAYGLGQIELAKDGNLYIAGNSTGSAAICNIIQVNFSNSFSPQFEDIALTGVGRGISDVVQSDVFGSLLSIEVLKADVSCAGGGDGTVDITIEGGIPPYEIKWNNIITEDLSFENLQPGFYPLEITDAGCLSSFFYQVVHIADPLPIEYIISFEEADCSYSGVPISLYIEGGLRFQQVPYYTVDWQGIDPDAAPIGEHYVIISDSNHCTEIVNFEVIGPERLSFKDTSMEIMCYGDLAEVQVWDIEGGTPPYLINGSNQTSVFFPAGDHTVTIEDDNGCTISRYYTFDQPDEIIIQYEIIQDSCNVLTAVGTADAYGGSGDLIVEFVGANPDNIKPGYFYITATDTNGCELLQLAEFIPDATSVNVPNAFSPNGDSYNDYFFPKIDCFQSLDLVIYDRWGKLMFETEDPNSIGWDGQVDGDAAVQDVYIYEFNYITSRGFEKQIQGTVLLVF